MAAVCWLQSERAGADVLALYQFPAASSFASSDSDLLSTASNFSFSGMGVSGTDYGRSTATSAPHQNTIYTRGSFLTTSEAAADTAGDYYSFTLTPDPGNALNLSSLTFVTDATQGGTAPSYTANFFVRSSVDGFVSNIASFSDGPATLSNAVFTNRSVDLSGASFQNLSSAVTFRIYLFHDGTTPLSADAITRSDSYTLNGTVVAVPEPSTYVLMGLGLGGLLLFRRLRPSPIPVRN